MSSQPQPTDSPKGYAFALGAYLLWGLLPLYMKAMAHIPAAEVIAHRVIWSLPIAAAVLLYQGRTSDIRAAIARPRLLSGPSPTITRWKRRLAITSTRCFRSVWPRFCWANG
jgi:chloramphenicol-sensitive protein RarD